MAFSSRVYGFGLLGLSVVCAGTLLQACSSDEGVTPGPVPTGTTTVDATPPPADGGMDSMVKRDAGDSGMDASKDPGKPLPGAVPEEPVIEAEYDYLRDATILRVSNLAEVYAKYPDATFRWQRKQVGVFADLPDVTGAEWFDSTAPLGDNIYRVVVTSSGKMVESNEVTTTKFSVKTIGAGATYSCALKSDGSPVCHGSETKPPTGETFEQLSVGYFTACGIRATGIARCWSDFAVGGEAPPAATTTAFASIFGGLFYTCGIVKDTRALSCIGGNRAISTYGLPGFTVPAGAFASAAGTARGGCGIVQGTGEVTCWGDFQARQANGSVQWQPYVAPTGVFKSLSGAPDGRVICGITSGDTVRCWGDGFTLDAPDPAGPFKAVHALADGACVEAPTGAVSCFGANYVNASFAALPGSGYQVLSSAAGYLCGLKSDGKILCAGSNPDERARLPSAASFSKVSTGPFSTCGIRSDKSIECLGGQDPQLTPLVPPASGQYTDIAVADTHACALTVAGKLVCFGSNNQGQAPAGPSAASYKRVVVGATHTCMINADDKLECLGNNTRGKAPPGPSTDTFKDLAAGPGHTCGLLMDGTLKCFGDNTLRQAPTTPPASKFTAVSAGFAHTCGLRTDGKLECIGDGTYGQSPRSSPITYDAVVAGGAITCGLNKGNVLCYGAGQERFTLSVQRYQSFAGGGYVENIQADDATVFDHTCGVRADDGKLICEGQNSFGQAPRL
jgi:Regulator of chromosome condensation (RCC1) repeat